MCDEPVGIGPPLSPVKSGLICLTFGGVAAIVLGIASYLDNASPLTLEVGECVLNEDHSWSFKVNTTDGDIRYFRANNFEHLIKDGVVYVHIANPSEHEILQEHFEFDKENGTLIYDLDGTESMSFDAQEMVDYLRHQHSFRSAERDFCGREASQSRVIDPTDTGPKHLFDVRPSRESSIVLADLQRVRVRS